MKRHLATFHRQWPWPIVLAAPAGFAFVSALVGDSDILWRLSSSALAVSLIVIVRHWPLRRPFQRKIDL